MPRFTPTTRRRLRLVVALYLVKAVLVGAACLVVPDLPERTLAMVRETWARLAD